MIREHAVQDGDVAFFLRNMPNNKINVVAEYVKKTRKGWIWGFGGGFSASNIRLGLSDSEALKESFHIEYFSSTEGSEYSKTPFPMFYGVVINQDCFMCL